MRNECFLYHITKLRYLDSILTNGLLIDSGKNGFVGKSYLKNYYRKYNMQPIFLTNDIDYIIKTQLTKKFLKDSCVLKIDASTLILEDELYYLNSKWYLYYRTEEDMVKNTLEYKNKSFICRENIKPGLIYEERFTE